jgi:putative oxidoreductase
MGGISMAAIGMIESSLARWSSELLSIFRIMTAFTFMQHGTQKMFGFPAEARVPFEFFTRNGVAGLLEVFGGLLMLFGLFTRPVAFVLSGLMAFAYFLVHAPRGFWPLPNGGDLAVMYCFAFLYMAAAGAGKWSLDNVWRRQS